MGGYHLNALQQLAAGNYEDYYKGGINNLLSKIRVVGLCDILPGRTENNHNIDRFDFLPEMLESTSPHILIVATPTNTHKEMASSAIECGVHTFVEKPIVANVSQLNELMSLARKKGCKLIAGHVERYNPVSIKIISLLKDVKPLVENYSFTRTQKHDTRITDDIITDKVIHDLDLALYFFGAISSIKIDNFRMSGEKVYELGLRVEHQNGTKGSIFVSWLDEQQTKKRQVEIAQGGHTWKGDFVSKQLWVDGAEIKCEVQGMVKPANNQIKDELVDFIASCINVAPLQEFIPLLSIEEISESTRWLEDIYKQIQMR